VYHFKEGVRVLPRISEVKARVKAAKEGGATAPDSEEAT
jgi:hypothetical protein